MLGVAPLPAVSKLKPRDGAKVTEPIIGSDVKLKTHVLRNGRHRFLSEDEYLRCFEIAVVRLRWLDTNCSTVDSNQQGRVRIHFLC